MGYAKLDQKDLGIHFRQWSRAFIISDGLFTGTVVFISVDVCMATQLMKMRVRLWYTIHVKFYS